eukprot:gene15023-21094_t
MAQPCPEIASFFNGCSEGRQRFDLHDIMGRGAYGVVCSATDKLTGQKVAIKKIKDVFDCVADATRILREIKFGRLLDTGGEIDQGVVTIRHIILPSDPAGYDDVFVVLELFESDLHTVIDANEDLSPAHHKFFFYQLLSALNFLHLSGVLHRDLKPRNVLANGNCKLKICDLGLARSFDRENSKCTSLWWTDYVATRWYRAPELLGCFYGYYNEAVDIWSMGCIFAEILLRRPLFPGRDTRSQFELITNLLGKPSTEILSRISNFKARAFLQQMPPKAAMPFEAKFPGVDPAALDLLQSMLSFDPAMRPTAEEALSHPFFSGLPIPTSQAVSIPPECFAFERVPPTEKDKPIVRDLIYKEILNYYPEAKALYAEGYSYGKQVMAQLVQPSGPFPDQSAPMMWDSPAQPQAVPPLQEAALSGQYVGGLLPEPSRVGSYVQSKIEEIRGTDPMMVTSPAPPQQQRAASCMAQLGTDKIAQSVPVQDKGAQYIPV